MQPHPSRFRPHIERLEDRHLPAVAVSFGGGTLTLAATFTSDRITVFNNGRGHIKGYVTGWGALNDPTTQDGFFDVRRLEIFTAGGGAEFHQVEDGFNPSGSQVDTLALNVHLGNRADSFTADLHGHAIHGGILALAVFAGSGAADVRVKAAGVDIFGGVLSAVFVGGPREDRFSMNWSGVKAGTLRVWAYGNGGDDSLGLDAIFLGSASDTFVNDLMPLHPSGPAPGDLQLFGNGGNDNLHMDLSSPTGLPLTGYADGGEGVNNFFPPDPFVQVVNCRYQFPPGAFVHKLTSTGASARLAARLQLPGS
jgi:hypothetical protein